MTPAVRHDTEPPQKIKKPIHFLFPDALQYFAKTLHDIELPVLATPRQSDECRSSL